MANTCTVNLQLIFSDDEEIRAADFNEMELDTRGDIADFLIGSHLNMSPATTAYPSSAPNSNYIWSEGIQGTIKAGSGTRKITNNAGSIYIISGSTPSPTETDFAVFNCILPQDAFGFTAADFTPDASQARYATIGLTFSEADESETRDFYDAATDVITANVTNKRKQVTITPHITLGTPALSPTIPAFTGLPWGIVRIPAAFAGSFTDAAHITSCVIPRNVNQFHVSAFQGQTMTGTLNPSSGTTTNTTFHAGNTAVNANGAAMDTQLGNSFDQLYGGIRVANATNSHLLWSFPGVPGNATITQIDVYSTNGFANSGTYNLRANPHFGSTLYATHTVSGAGAQNFSMTGLSAPNSVTMEFITSNSNGHINYGFTVTYTQPSGGSGTYGFSANYASGHVTAAGTPISGFQYFIPCPITSPGARLLKFAVQASDVSGDRFRVASVSTSGGLTILITPDLDSVLSGNTFDLTQLQSSSNPTGNAIWCNGAASPFAGDNTGHQLGILWEPAAAGEWLGCVEFVVAGI